jgi:hypothetical protein
MLAKELLVLAKELLATDFPSKEALDEYLREHPDADRSNHKVVETKKPMKPVKKDTSVLDSLSEDLTDSLEGQVLRNKNQSEDEIAKIIKSDSGLSRMMRKEGMKDDDLIDFIKEAKRMYR